jgi:ubiquinone/menaquinone biosynthesis C-methylase UbiE
MEGSKYAQLDFLPELRVNDYDDISPWYDLVMGDDFVRTSFPILAGAARHIVPANGVKLRHLDLACCTGAVLCAFGQAFDSDSLGIDISSGQLRVAAEKARKLGLTASFRQEDVLRSQFQGEYDIVTMGCDALNHVTSRHSWALLFRRVHRALSSRGIFVFDVNSPRRLLRDLNFPEVIIKEGCNLPPLRPEPQRGPVFHQVLPIK